METAIDDANQATWKSFRSMFLDEGFHQEGKNFVKNTIVGATLMDALQENHVIEGYRSFKAEVRDFSSGLMKPEEIDLASIGAEGVQALLADAMDAVSIDYERLFGGDDLASTYVRQYTEQEKYEKTYTSYNYATQSYVNRVVEKTRTVSRETRDGIDKEAFEKYVSNGDSLNGKAKTAYEQSERVVELKAGEFNAWVGYAPVFKSDADPGKSVENYMANVRFPGYGETGRLMGMFIQHKMIEGAGEAACDAPFYSRKLWDDRGSWFSAPSIRSIADIAMTIAVTCVTGVGAMPLSTMLAAAGANMIDDAIFTVMDIANGLDASDALQGFAKKGLVSVGTAFIGAKFNGVLKVADKTSTVTGGLAQTLNVGDSVMRSTLLKGAEIMTSNIASSAINALDFEAMFKGKDFFNEKAFNEGAFGEGAMAGVVAGMAGNFVSGALGKWNLTDANKTLLNKFTFDVKSIQRFNGVMGSMVGAGITYGMTGNATFNVASIAGTGFMELHVGEDGFGMNFGTSGTDVSFQTLSQAMRGYREADKVTDWKTGTEEQRSTLNGINMLGWTGAADNKQNIDVSKAIWNGELDVRYDDLATGNQGYYHSDNNPDEIVLSRALLGGGKESAAKLAAVMSHEGSHWSGTNVEETAYKQGQTTYSQINAMFNLKSDDVFCQSMINAINDPKNKIANDPRGRQDWLVRKNGDIYDDGVDGEVSFEDGRETFYAKDKRKQQSLEEFLVADARSLDGLFDETGFEFVKGKGWVEAGKTIGAASIQKLVDSGVIKNSSYIEGLSGNPSLARDKYYSGVVSAYKRESHRQEILKKMPKENVNALPLTSELVEEYTGVEENSACFIASYAINNMKYQQALGNTVTNKDVLAALAYLGRTAFRTNGIVDNPDKIGIEIMNAIGGNTYLAYGGTFSSKDSVMADGYDYFTEIRTQQANKNREHSMAWATGTLYDPETSTSEASRWWKNVKLTNVRYYGFTPVKGWK